MELPFLFVEPLPATLILLETIKSVLYLSTTFFIDYKCCLFGAAFIQYLKSKDKINPESCPIFRELDFFNLEETAF